MKQTSGLAVNNREAENVGTRASHYLAHHDSLTNALNADAFYELSREMVKKQPDTQWVMITSNIMNFRLINTLFGVFKGNEVLVRTAAMLREISDRARGLCGRLGGDRFALLIPRTGYREAALLDTASQLARLYSSGMFTFYIHFGVYMIDDAGMPRQLQTTKLKFIDEAGRPCLLGMCVDVTEAMVMKREAAEIQEEAEKIEAERAGFSRISALSGDDLSIYEVDLVTGYYVEYDAASDFRQLGIPSRGGRLHPERLP